MKITRYQREYPQDKQIAQYHKVKLATWDQSSHYPGKCFVISQTIEEDDEIIGIMRSGVILWMDFCVSGFIEGFVADTEETLNPTYRWERWTFVQDELEND